MIKIEVIGRQGRDVELHESNGHAYARGVVAVDVGRGNNKKTLWVNWTAFDKAGELLAKYQQKGSRVYLAGEPDVEAWKNKDGEAQASMKIIVRDFEFLDSKPAEGESKKADSGIDDVPF